MPKQPAPKKSVIEQRQSASYRLRQSLSALGQRALKILLRDPLAWFLLLAAIGLGITFFNLLDDIQPQSPGSQVTLTEVTELARDRQIATATLYDQDSRIVLRTRPEQRQAREGEPPPRPAQTLWAAYPSSGASTGALLTALQRAGATTVVDQQSDIPTKKILVQFLLPILLLVTLFAFFMRLSDDEGAGGIASFSKFTGRRRKKGDNGGVTFANVAGNPEAIAELKEIRDYLADPSKYSSMGASAPKGVLLVGPPGTGKTLIARAVAGEADATFFSMSGSDFVESLVGVGAARVRDLFGQARKVAPAIIFIDELDAAGRKRGAGIGQGNDEREQTLNQILVEMDGFGGDAGIVVMGATNRPDILDPALLRPGRFDRQVTVDVPDVHGRYEILSLHAKGKPLDRDADLREIAKLTPGFSGAELANVVNEAALLTVREGREEIDQPTLEEAIDRVVAGPAKKTHILTPDERWVIAVHEAAHAVAARSIGQAVSAQKLSIVARGRQLGTAAHMLTDRDQLIQQEQDLRRQLVAVLAGAAGEKLEFGVLSTGVHDDLFAATSLARSMVTSFGMSDELGPVTIGERQGEVFLGASLQELGSVGPDTLNLIDREVERAVGEAVAHAALVLERNWGTVVETAEALLEHETLSGLALEALLSPVVPIPVPGDLPPARPGREAAPDPRATDAPPGDHR
jgi:cell division protease FtsH